MSLIRGFGRTALLFISVAIPALGLRTAYDYVRGRPNILLQTYLNAPAEVSSKPKSLEKTVSTLYIEPQGIIAPTYTKDPRIKNGRIYHSWPSLINGIRGDDDARVKAVSNLLEGLDLFVYGGGLEKPIEKGKEVHDDYQNTINIIKNLKGKTKQFGYVSIGVGDHAPEELLERNQAWFDMGVDGIFVDRASPTYGVDYGLLEYFLTDCRRIRTYEEDGQIKERKLEVFINSDNPTWIKNAPRMKDGSRMIQEGDYVLQETFAAGDKDSWEATNYYKDWPDNPGIHVCGAAQFDILDRNKVATVPERAQEAAIREGLYILILGDPSWGVEGAYKDKMIPP